MWNDRVVAEAHAERVRRQAEEQEALRRRWTAWVYSAPGTPPPSSPVPPDWQRLRDGWLHVKASTRAYAGAGWGNANPRRAPPGGADPARAGARPTLAELASSAGVLGLRWPCSADAAHAAYRRLAVEHHPDRAGAGATARMAQINVAFQVVQRGLGAA